MPNEEGRTLTERDIQAIVSAMSKRDIHACMVELSKEDATFLKEFIATTKRARNTIGTLVLTFFVLGILALMARGFWTSWVAK